MGEISLTSTKSGAGQGFLLPGCMAKAPVKTVFFSQTPLIIIKIIIIIIIIMRMIMIIIIIIIMITIVIIVIIMISVILTVAIFYPCSQFCEIDVSLPSL